MGEMSASVSIVFCLMVYIMVCFGLMIVVLDCLGIIKDWLKALQRRLR